MNNDCVSYLNDCDLLYFLLDCEKNMSSNLNMLLNLNINEFIYNEIYDMFDIIREAYRNIYSVYLHYNGYSLNNVSNDILSIKLNEFSSMMSKLVND